MSVYTFRDSGHGRSTLFGLQCKRPYFPLNIAQELENIITLLAKNVFNNKHRLHTPSSVQSNLLFPQ